jgi:hypothetical protein
MDVQVTFRRLTQAARLIEGVGQGCVARLASAEVSLVESGGTMLVVVMKAWLVFGELLD